MSGGSAGALAVWADVDAGPGRQPVVEIDGRAYPDTRGVQFLINGVVDERHDA